VVLYGVEQRAWRRWAGTGGLAPWMARARWSVNEPAPVPASKISYMGPESWSASSPGTGRQMSRREVIRVASWGYIYGGKAS